MQVKHRCLKCHRLRELCTCVDICSRCGYPHFRCVCEQSLRPARYEHEEKHLAPDEDREDDFRRDYASESQSAIYWQGYRAAQRRGKYGTIRCPHSDAAKRRDFYRGVSDARWNL